LSVDGANARTFPEVVVVLVYLDLPFRCVQGQPGGGCEHTGYIETASFLHRFLPQVNGCVRCSHWVTDHALFTVTGFEGRDKLIVCRVLDALEVAHAGKETCEVFGADAGNFFLSNCQSHQSLVAAVDSCSLELLVERHIGATNDGREDDVGFSCLDLVDHRRELNVAERRVLLSDDRTTVLCHRSLGQLVSSARPDIVRAH